MYAFTVFYQFYVLALIAIMLFFLVICADVHTNLLWDIRLFLCSCNGLCCSFFLIHHCISSSDCSNYRLFGRNFTRYLLVEKASDVTTSYLLVEKILGRKKRKRQGMLVFGDFCWLSNVLSWCSFPTPSFLVVFIVVHHWVIITLILFYNRCCIFTNKIRVGVSDKERHCSVSPLANRHKSMCRQIHTSFFFNQELDKKLYSFYCYYNFSRRDRKIQPCLLKTCSAPRRQQYSWSGKKFWSNK